MLVNKLYKDTIEGIKHYSLSIQYGTSKDIARAKRKLGV